MKRGRPKGSGKGLPWRKPFPMWERKATFWSRVQTGSRDECWPWKGPADPQTGYGKFCWNNFTTSAHRFAWIATYGVIPKGLLVCHKCDNRICQNPHHLFLGTIADNNADMRKKGRGSKPPSSAKITREQVIQIRKLWVPYKTSMRTIAKLLKVPYKSVESAVNPKRWNQIPWT
jgi:hypothetical protein